MGNNVSLQDSLHSRGIQILSKNVFKVAVGGEHEVLTVPFTLLEKLFTVSLRVAGDFNKGTPFVGVLTEQKNLEEISIPNDSDLILWDMKERFIYWKGKKYCKTKIVFSSDSKVDITWNMKTQTIKFQVKSIDGDIQTDEILTDELESCQQLWLVLGATHSSQSKPIQFEILSESKAMRDVTASVCFTSAGGKVTISQESKQIYRSNKEKGNCVIVLNRTISHGKHYWRLAVVSDFGASIAIGIAEHDFQLSEKFLQDPMKHVYHHPGLHLWRSYRGYLYSDGKQLPYSLEPLGWKNGFPMMIELFLDMDARILTISKNGKDLGIAFKGFNGPVRPCVAFYAGFEKELVLEEFRSSEEGSSGDIVEADSGFVKQKKSKSIGFDPNSMHGTLVLSEDSMTLTREKEYSGNSYCLLAIPLTNGFYRWSFIIQNDQGASTIIGVAREPINLNKTGNLYLCPDFYVLRSFQGILYSEGKEVKKGLSEYWLSGSLVEVSYEVQPHGKGGIVRFSINGEDQGVAFTGVTPPVRPIVGFYAGMQKKVTLVHYEHIPAQPSSPAPSSKLELNKVNTDRTNASKQHPMPLFLRSSDVVTYYPACMVCGSPVDTVALPCKHSYMCAQHLDIGQSCLICDDEVTDIWNIIFI